MKGVILPGGLGARLHPLTRITNTHLQPVFDPTEEPGCGARNLHVGCGRHRRDHDVDVEAVGWRARDHGREQRVLRRGDLGCEILRGWWTDAGSFDALHRAGNLVVKTGANGLDPAGPEEAMIEGVGLKRLAVHSDGRVLLMEVLKSSDRFFQTITPTTYTKAFPGVIKACPIGVAHGYRVLGNEPAGRCTTRRRPTAPPVRTTSASRSTIRRSASTGRRVRSDFR